MEIIYDQCEMRNHLPDYLQSNKIKPFPRFNRTRGEEQFIDITNNVEDTNKKGFQIKHMSQTKTAIF